MCLTRRTFPFPNSRNFEIVSIGFLGSFVCQAPSRSAITALYNFLDYIQHADPSTDTTNKSQPILDTNFTIYGHCQLNLYDPVEHPLTFADSPGAAFMKDIRLWEYLVIYTHFRWKTHTQYAYTFPF